MNILQRLLVRLIRLYQLTLSMVMGRQCRFYPSCSSYSMEAIELHGVSRGLMMTIKRVACCHPWHPGGVDPVPRPQADSE